MQTHIYCSTHLYGFTAQKTYGIGCRGGALDAPPQKQKNTAHPFGQTVFFYQLI